MKQVNFYDNLAEEMDERTLARMASELLDDYHKDKVSRADWEKTYTQGLELLGFKYNDQTRPFSGASGVTHPLLAEAVTQFQAQAYKELLPSDGPVTNTSNWSRDSRNKTTSRTCRRFHELYVNGKRWKSTLQTLINYYFTYH
jgi:hypothetical protein